MSYELLHFLIEENVLKQFVDNCKQSVICDLYIGKLQPKKERIPCLSIIRTRLSSLFGNPIYDAFLWSRTPEGFSFWQNIYFKWWNR